MTATPATLFTLLAAIGAVAVLVLVIIAALRLRDAAQRNARCCRWQASEGHAERLTLFPQAPSITEADIPY